MRVLSTLLLLFAIPAFAQPSIVASLNVYGDIAAQVAGPDAKVTSILTNPDQDPHLFEASPSTGRALAGAAIVIANGAGYDPWMTKLLAAGRSPKRQVLVVAELVRSPAGGNPHLWYDPAVPLAVAKAIAAALGTADPAHTADYTQRLRAFEASLAPVGARIADLRARFAGQPVTATEPVFGLMARAIGLTMRNERFQLATMNGAEPRASDVAAFERDLRERKVRVLLYNSQATGPMAQRLLRLARESGVAVVAVTETEPPDTTYQAWMLDQLGRLEAALTP